MAHAEERMIEVNFDKDKWHLQHEMREWCRISFGPGMWMNPRDHTNSWGWASAFGYTTYYFKNEHEASAFILRWK